VVCQYGTLAIRMNLLSERVLKPQDYPCVFQSDGSKLCVVRRYGTLAVCVNLLSKCVLKLQWSRYLQVIDMLAGHEVLS